MNEDKKDIPPAPVDSTGKPITGGNDVQTRVYLEQLYKPHNHVETYGEYLRRTDKR